MPENREMTVRFLLVFFPHPYVAIYPPANCGKPTPVRVRKIIKHYIKQRELLVKQMQARMLRKGNPSYTIGGNVNWCDTLENSLEAPQNVSNRTPMIQ